MKKGLEKIGKGGKTVAYLIRHPSTSANDPKNERVRSWGGNGITARGRRDLQQDAEKLHGKGIDRVYHSDIPRAQEAGKKLASSLGVPATETPALRPVNWGKFEGQKVSKVKGQIDNLIRHPDKKIPGSTENYRGFLTRRKKALDGILSRPGTPAVVVHGSHMRSLDAYLHGDKKLPNPGDETSAPPGSIIALKKSGAKQTLFKPKGLHGLSNSRS